jgi:hypothetical protein
MSTNFVIHRKATVLENTFNLFELADYREWMRWKDKSTEY